MIELYHAPISTCSQKIRLLLAEKNLEWQSREINLQAGEQHDPAYKKLNPSAVVPTVVDDGKVYVESGLITEYLDEQYPEPPLSPTNAGERHAMRWWMRQVDQKVHMACGVLTYAIGIRPTMLNRPRDEVLAMFEKIPNKARRAARLSVFEHGINAPEISDALHEHQTLFAQMETRLADREWLAGDAYSLAEINVLPYLTRFEHMSMMPLIEAHPRVNDWYQRAKARPSYEKGINDFAPPPVVENMQQAGVAVWPTIQSKLQH